MLASRIMQDDALQFQRGFHIVETNEERSRQTKLCNSFFIKFHTKQMVDMDD